MSTEGPQEPGSEQPDAAEAGEAGAAQPLPQCGHCGAPLEDGQLYCLECGTPAPGAPGIDRARHRAGLVVVALVAAALIGGGVGFALGQDDGDATPAATAPTTSPAATAPSTAPATTAPTTGGLPPDTSVAPTTPGTVTTPDTSTTPETSTEPQELPSSTAAGTETSSAEPESDWPSDRESGWTAVVSSVRSGSEATATKGRVRDAGEPAGVLFSSDFSSLKPGYWVVFSGIFGSREAAAQQARALHPEFPGSYPRFIQA